MTTPLVRIVDDDADARSSSSFFLSMMWKSKSMTALIAFWKKTT